jgi:dTDP-4-dehydrorhamnose 3,5-epimerase
LRFEPLRLPGAFAIDRMPAEDERGFFARTWCAEEFAAHGLCTRLAQCSVSFNHRKGTLRGMHFQAAQHEEAKVVRCTRGAIYDVLLDLRPSSPTYRQWAAVELTEENGRQLYIPEGVAHGFQTLEDASEVFYHISEPYFPALARGVRWNDPAFAIEWPEDHRTISARDQQYPDFVA